MVYTVLLCIIVLIFLSIKHNKWQLMLTCSVVACVMSTLDMQGAMDVIGYAEKHIEAYETPLWHFLLLLTLVMAIALLRNRQENRKRDAEDKNAKEERM